MPSPDHRPRDDPYPDELDQLFCDECGTLCSPGRPCQCCLDDELPGGRLMLENAIRIYDMVLPKWPDGVVAWTPLRDNLPRVSR